MTKAMLPDLIIRPALTLLGVVGMYYLLPKFLNPQIAMGLSVVSSLVALSVAMIWLQKSLPKEC